MVGGSWYCLGVLPADEGLGGGTMLAEGPTREPPLKPPLPARPWHLRLTIPGKVWLHCVSMESWVGRVVVLGSRSSPLGPPPSRTDRVNMRW